MKWFDTIFFNYYRLKICISFLKSPNIALGLTIFIFSAMSDNLLKITLEDRKLEGRSFKYIDSDHVANGISTSHKYTTQKTETITNIPYIYSNR